MEITERDMHEMYVLNVYMAACLLDEYKIKTLGKQLLTVPGLQDVADIIRRTFGLEEADA